MACCEMTWPAWFDHLVESVYHEVQFKKCCPPVKTSCLPTENVNEIPDKMVVRFQKLSPSLLCST